MDEPDESPMRHRVRFVAGAFGVLVSVVAVVFAIDAYRTRDRILTFETAAREFEKPVLVIAEPTERRLRSYRGQGAWVDVFDSVEAYAGPNPPIGPAVVDDMAAHGVTTLYLQAARIDDRSPEGLVDPWLLAEFLQRAHAADIDVVGWYLPKWDVEADLARLEAIDEFAVLGHRFDGVAIDIEWVSDDLPAEERSARLVDLSARAAADTEGPLGAIVVPPSLMEVVNEDFWPGFPWRAIEPHYEAWLPMSYWSVRSEEFGDGYTYHVDSTARLRANIGNPDALVHGIGGIGANGRPPPDAEEPLASLDELARFEQALVDSRSVGGSVYDWNTMTPRAREQWAAAFATGPLAGLAR